MMSGGNKVSLSAKTLYELLSQSARAIQVGGEEKTAPKCDPEKREEGETQVIRKGDKVFVIDRATHDKLVLTETGRGYLLPNGTKKPTYADMNGNATMDSGDKGSSETFKRYTALFNQAKQFLIHPETAWRCEEKEETTKPPSKKVLDIIVFGKGGAHSKNSGFAFQIGERRDSSHFVVCQRETESCFKFVPGSPNTPKEEKTVEETLSDPDLRTAFNSITTRMDSIINITPEDQKFSRTMEEGRVQGRCNSRDPISPVRSLNKLKTMFDKTSCPAFDLQITLPRTRILAVWDFGYRIPFFDALKYTNNPAQPDFWVMEKMPSSLPVLSAFIFDIDAKDFFRTIEEENK